MWSWATELPATRYDSLILALICLIVGGIGLIHGIVKGQKHEVLLGSLALLVGVGFICLYAHIVANPLGWGYK